MGGGLMQLVAYGAQDIYLTGNPQITFFKVVYRRHTNFSMEAIEQTINGSSQLGSSASSGTVTISRNGDLVHKIYITSSTPGILNGDALISDVELEIGGQQIDKHYIEWNQIWNELSTPSSKANGLKAMKCCVTDTHLASGDTDSLDGVGMVQLPLNFWFCRNPGLALPLIALQYHEVKLKINWGTSGLAGTSSSPASATCKVFCDYIYLDTDERRRFAQVSHEYLIEQLQKQPASNSKSQELNFNHPVKELIWTSAVENTYGTAKLILNGHDRFSAQEEEYFQLRQPYDYHTTVPVNNLPAHHIPGHNGSNPNGNKLITKGAGLLNSTTAGLSAACTTSSITLVTVAGSNAPLTELPAAGATLGASGVGIGSCVIVGALDSVSGIEPNSIRVGDRHEIKRFGTGNPSSTVHTVSFVVLSDVTGADAVVEISGTLGPLDHVNSGATPALLTSGGGVTNITNNANGAILICYDGVLQFPASTNHVQIHNTTTHESTPGSVIPHEAGTSLLTKKINVYSFALKPEEHQPSGTCNFSRIDNAKLNTNLALATGDNVYAVNYNVLRIMSGMGGLAYSN